MKRKEVWTRLAGAMLAGTMALTAAPLATFADEAGEWREEDGSLYWYEYDVKQGTEGRGKEIYDPASDAWYWLDAIDGGRKATSKDVYQESLAGEWGDAANEAGEKIGKWVRYDVDGHMVKGWQTNEAGTYYFDPVYGTMAKGNATIDGASYYFDPTTGILQNNAPVENGWWSENGKDYWYENGVRQGYDPDNADYRGKEIYDPASDAWYWLDNVQQGAKAVSKDVYQESLAGEWGETTNEAGERIGKWVRYDVNGHMVKGWNDQGGSTYYFDPTYGTMCKGLATIDGATYYFDPTVGTMAKNTTVTVGNTTYTFGEDGRADGTQEEESRAYKTGIQINYDSSGNSYTAGKSEYDEHDNVTNHINYNKDGSVSSQERYAYEYDANGNMTKMICYNKDGSVSSQERYEYDANGNITKKIQQYNAAGKVAEEREYDIYGNVIKYIAYDELGNVSRSSVYEYGEHGYYMTRSTAYDANGNVTYDKVINWNCEYDEEGRLISYTQIGNATSPYRGELEYTGRGIMPKRTTYIVEGKIDSRYDEYGNRTEAVAYEVYDTAEANQGDVKVEHFGPYSSQVQWYRWEYTYDEAGRMLQEISILCDKHGHEAERGVLNFTYDQNGNLLQQVGRCQAGSNVGLDYVNDMYEYDNEGRVIKETYYLGRYENDASLNHIINYTYN